MRRAFSLVELMIVVAVLGILAAIALPTFQDHIAEAKEAAAKNNLRILRGAIERYAAQHDGLPPGYFGTNLLMGFMVRTQLMFYTSVEGQAAPTKSPDFPYGSYLSEMPENPFNNKATVRLLTDDELFPDSADGTYGWIYKPATKEIRLDWPGTDKDGVRYYDY